MTKGLTNEQVVTLSVYLLGGEDHPVDTEDVAVKANELVPGKYTWTKYPDQIKLENVRAFLTHCKEQKHGGYLTGTGRLGWRLTPAGVAFARENVERLVDEDQCRRLYEASLERRGRDRARIIALPAVQKALAGGGDFLSKRELESVFRLNAYIRGERRAEKIRDVVAALRDDPELGQVVVEMAEKLEREETD